MDRDDALLIKQWRVNGSSWRRISERATKKWPDKGYETDNQLEGRELCWEASKTLGENWYEEPWI